MNDGEDGGHFRRPVKKHVNEVERRIRFMLVGVEAELQRLYRQFVAELQRLNKQFVKLTERDASIQGQRSQSMEEQQLVTVASAAAGSTQSRVQAQRGASSGFDFTQVNPIQDDDMNDGVDGGHFRRPVKKQVYEVEQRIRFMLVDVEAELQRLYKQFVKFKERDASIQGQRSQAMEEQHLVTVASADAGSTQGKVHRCCQQPVFAKAALAGK